MNAPVPADNTRLTMVDGRDALAVVMIRPGPTPDSVYAEATACGISKREAAPMLLEIARLWLQEDS